MSVRDAAEAVADKVPRKRASTVAKNLGIELPRLGELLGKPDIKPASLVSPEQEDEVKAKLSGDGNNGNGSSQALVQRPKTDKGRFSPLRLDNKPLKITAEDKQVLYVLQKAVDTALKYADPSRRRESRTNRKGQIEIQDVLFADRWIRMEVPEFQARKAQGTLPPLHQTTIRQMSEPLSRLSLVNTNCRICGEALEAPYYKGMIEVVLAGKADLPFRPNHGRALKFPDRHKSCRVLYAMMAEVELELEDIPEHDGKDAKRYEKYREALMADEGTMLAAVMGAEYRKVSASTVMSRLDKIVEGIKAKREELS